MVRINIYPDGFSAIGHAEYAPIGQDIVCSAISTLVQTTALALKTYCHVNIEVDQGDVYVYLKSKSGKSTILIGAMVIGLREIEKQYPKHLSIEERWQ